MKIAVIHDWLVTIAGAEKVLAEILAIYPDADLFAVVDFLNEDQREFISNKTSRTTFIQKFPIASSKYRAYLPFMPLAIEQLDLSDYDLVISSSHAVAKGVITGPDQVHVSYVHSPIRYAWDMQHQYLRESGLDKGGKSWLTRWVLHKMRIWDARTAHGVDHFIANSRFIARRIQKVYGRQAQVINPPINVDHFPLVEEKDDFYLTASRMVAYKRIDLIVQAFNRMPQKRLLVIGTGPDFKKIKSLAGPNVELLGYQSDEVLRDLMGRARAFVFAAEEDFGIIPVEAQACGTPVIAYGKGGILDSIIADGDQPTGLFFDAQNCESLCSAVERFDQLQTKFSPIACRRNAERFSPVRFRDEIKNAVNEALEIHQRYRFDMRGRSQASSATSIY